MELLANHGRHSGALRGADGGHEILDLLRHHQAQHGEHVDGLGRVSGNGRPRSAVGRSLNIRARQLRVLQHDRQVATPYLRSFSNHYSKDKFVNDGLYNPTAISKQCGAAVMLRALIDDGAVEIT
jgi:hypothetical protein